MLILISLSSQDLELLHITYILARRASIHKMSFLQLIHNTIYANELGTEKWYEVYVSCSFKHWFLLVKEGGTSSPFITFEITKDAGHNVAAIMRNNICTLPPTNFIFKGTVWKSMYELCSIADGVRCEMGKYDLFTNNCQDFCNKYLKVLGLPTQSTSTTLLFVSVAAGIIITFLLPRV